MRQGLSEESEAMLCNRRDRYDTAMREVTSSSPNISAISSTGKDSKSYMAKGDFKVVVLAKDWALPLDVDCRRT